MLRIDEVPTPLGTVHLAASGDQVSWATVPPSGVNSDRLPCKASPWSSKPAKKDCTGSDSTRKDSRPLHGLDMIAPSAASLRGVAHAASISAMASTHARPATREITAAHASA